MIIALIAVLILLELVFFKIADKLAIVDKPNKRSSHMHITRRGGGIIFPIAWLLFFMSNGFVLPFFTAGLVLIAVVSFWDDIKEVGVIPRISIQTIALALAFYDLGLFSLLPLWGFGICLLIGLSALNAINFMDGINGITGLYALGFWVTIALFGGQLIPGDIFSLKSPLPFILASVVVFGFFNFRKKAICFAGDVGSVSMAYLIIGMVAFMIFHSEGTVISRILVLNPEGMQLKYLLLLVVYGVDSLLTILHRLLIGENILKGHRKHLYQYLVNEYKFPHITVAFIYSAIQLCISIWVLNADVLLWQGLLVTFILSGIYLVTKAYILKTINGHHLRIEKEKTLGALSQEIPHLQRTKKIS